MWTSRIARNTSAVGLLFISDTKVHIVRAFNFRWNASQTETINRLSYNPFIVKYTLSFKNIKQRRNY